MWSSCVNKLKACSRAQLFLRKTCGLFYWERVSRLPCQSISLRHQELETDTAQAKEGIHHAGKSLFKENVHSDHKCAW